MVGPSMNRTLVGVLILVAFAAARTTGAAYISTPRMLQHYANRENRMLVLRAILPGYSNAGQHRVDSRVFFKDR